MSEILKFLRVFAPKYNKLAIDGHMSLAVFPFAFATLVYQ